VSAVALKANIIALARKRAAILSKRPERGVERGLISEARHDLRSQIIAVSGELAFASAFGSAYRRASCVNIALTNLLL
jgi:hypothetical protein